MSTYTILSAAFTNPWHTGASIETVEAGAVLVTPAQPDLWAQALAVGPTDFSMPAQPAPAAVTQRQARLALRAASKLAAVNAAIAAMPGDAGEDARIEWEFASTIDRASPLVAAMGAALAMDGPALDELFRQAAAL